MIEFQNVGRNASMQPYSRSLKFNIIILVLTFSAVVLMLLALLWPKQPSSNSVSADFTQYTAKSVGNQVVIYETGRSEPVLLTGIDIRTLPEADRQALAVGIGLQDATALAHLLEDYDA